MHRLDQLFLSWWFPNLFLLVICVAILTVAALMTPSTEMLSFFGYEVPVMCSFRRFTGYGCPGCGLTRSFTFFAHGELLQGIQMNLLGLPMFLVVAAQVPYRILRLVRGAPTPPEPRMEAPAR